MAKMVHIGNEFYFEPIKTPKEMKAEKPTGKGHTFESKKQIEKYCEDNHWDIDNCIARAVLTYKPYTTRIMANRPTSGFPVPTMNTGHITTIDIAYNQGGEDAGTEQD